MPKKVKKSPLRKKSKSPRRPEPLVLMAADTLKDEPVAEEIRVRVLDKPVELSIIKPKQGVFKTIAEWIRREFS